MKKILVVFILTGMIAAFTIPNQTVQRKSTQLIPKTLEVGEEIIYVVKYSFIELGKVKLQILSKEEKDGKVFYKTKVYMDSNPGIPFVNLHQIYESYFNQQNCSDYFRATEKEKNYVKFTEYFFQYEKNQIHVKKGKFNPFQIWTDSTAKIKTNYQDGLSLFYYARLNTGQKKSVDIPCFVTEKFETTRINFYNTIEKISIDAVDYDISCTKLDGYTTFVSVFGLTGKFEGWFTNDQYAVPVLAKMKVIIGDITLELKEWRKKNWLPPHFK